MDRDKTGQPLRIPIRALDILGNGLGQHGGRRYHIPFVLPGEIVEGETVYNKGQEYYAYPEYVDKPNPKRIKADCKHFGRCAGCSYRHLTYPDSFAEKWEQTKKLLAPLGELYLKPHPAKQHRYYRTVARFYVHNGHVTQHTLLDHQPFVLEVCRLIDREALALAKQLAILPVTMIEVWSAGAGVHMVALHTEEERITVSVPVEYPVYLAKDGVYSHLQGPETIPYALEVRGVPMTLHITPNSFVQSNTSVTEALISTVIGHIPNDAKTLLELYGGMGTLTIPLAHFCPTVEITSLEYKEEMVAQVTMHAKAQGLTNITAQVGDLGTSLTHATPDVVLLDPPRKGLHTPVLEYITAHTPEHIIYVSCNPETFVQDAKRLLELYNCTALHYFDMMPYTRHGEVVGVFVRKK